MRFRLPHIAKKHPVAFWSATVLHIGLLAALGYSEFQRMEQRSNTVVQKEIAPKPNQTVSIDLEAIEKEKKRLQDIEKQKEKRAAELKERERRAKEVEKQKALAEKKAREAEQRRIRAEILAQEEEEREKQARAKAKAAEDKRKKAEQERQEEERKAQAAREVNNEAERKQRATEEKIRIAQEKRKAEQEKFENEQEARRLVESIQKEQDIERALARDELLNELSKSYINQIQAKIRRNWRFQRAEGDWGCDVYILQDVSGNVETVTIRSCDVDDPSVEQPFRDSIERAVYRASPLPGAPDKAVFDREILIFFRVN